jgi:ribosomal-protein-alanine N-acetyltransferase
MNVLGFRRSTPPAIETQRMVLRLPEMADHAPWSLLRRRGEAFLKDWEPSWSADHFSRRAFRNRVYWAWRAREEGRALALFLIRRADSQLDAGPRVATILVERVMKQLSANERELWRRGQRPPARWGARHLSR